MSPTIYLNLFPPTETLFVCEWVDAAEEGKCASFIPFRNKRCNQSSLTSIKKREDKGEREESGRRNAPQESALAEQIAGLCPVPHAGQGHQSAPGLSHMCPLLTHQHTPCKGVNSCEWVTTAPWSHPIVKVFYPQARSQICEVTLWVQNRQHWKTSSEMKEESKIFSHVPYTVDKPIKNIASYANWFKRYRFLVFVPREPHPLQWNGEKDSVINLSKAKWY